MYNEFTIHCDMASYQVLERDSREIVWQGTAEGIEFIPGLMDIPETQFYTALRRRWIVRSTPRSDITHAEKMAIIQAYQASCAATMALVRQSLG